MKKGIYSAILAATLTISVFALPIINSESSPDQDDPDAIGRSSARITNENDNKTKPTEDNTPKNDETVTFIITVNGDSLVDTVLKSGNEYSNVTDLLKSNDGRSYVDTIKKNQAVVKASILKLIPEADFDSCYTYNTVINGFSVTAPYSSLEKLRNVSGVTSVTLASSQNITISENEIEEDDFSESTDKTETSETSDSSEKTQKISNEKNDQAENSDNIEVFDKEELDLTDKTALTNEMINISAAYEEELSGSGNVIAVIDDSFDCGHEVFSVSPDDLKYTGDDISKLISSAPFNISSNSSVVKNNKIIYAYDYADNDDDPLYAGSSHGTHNAALIAGNNGKDDKELFRGEAYDSQLILMKVCSDENKSAKDDALLAALDDTAKLSPDILNISLGVPRICSTAEILTTAFNALSQTGTYIVSAAGNNSENVSILGEYGVNAEYTDYGTISYPASLPFVTAAGSTDAGQVLSRYFITSDGKEIPYKDMTVSDDSEYPLFADLGEENDYIYIDGTGQPEDYFDISVKDKIVIMNRGETSFNEKVIEANSYDAKGIIVLSDEPLYLNFSTEERDIPAVVISDEYREYFQKHTEGKIEPKGYSVFDSKNAGNPSAFTSYGVTYDLKLKPDITAPGTEIFSASSEGYSAKSGTSSSSALIAGTAGILSEYFSSRTDIPITSKNTAIAALMMNTAVPAKYNSNAYYTPRLQGAGCLDIAAAIKAEAYITDENDLGSVSMGDNENGSFDFHLTVHSLTDKDVVYTPGSFVQTDKLEKHDGVIYNTLSPENITSKSSVIYKIDGKEIKNFTLPAGEKVELEVEITLSPELVLNYMNMAKNGFYTDGFVFLSPADNSSLLSVPFMGYCGSWADAELFDCSVYDLGTEPAIGHSALFATSSLGNSCLSLTLGKNAMTGRISKNTITIGTDTIKNAYDVSEAGVSFILPNFYLLRDAANYNISIEDQVGNTIYSQNIGTVSSFAGGTHEPYTSLLTSFNTDGLKNLFSDLDEGKYKYTVSAGTIGYDGSISESQSMSLNFTVDNTAPDKPSAKIYCTNNKVYLDVTSEDENGIQGFILYTASKSGDKHTYADRLEDLANDGYIDSDSYVLADYVMNETKSVFTYDITELYMQLKKLAYYAEENEIEQPLSTKMFIRAADNAFNLSVPLEVDTTVMGTVTYTVTDQNNDPVSDAVFELNGKKVISDEKGVVEFKNVLPDVYAISLVSLPEDYRTDFKYDLVIPSLSEPQISRNLQVTYTGKTHKTIEDKDTSLIDDVSVGATISENSDTDENAQKDILPDQDIDHSYFGLIFIASLLIISITSLAISRKKRKYPNYDDMPSVDNSEETSE